MTVSRAVRPNSSSRAVAWTGTLTARVFSTCPGEESPTQPQLLIPGVLSHSLRGNLIQSLVSTQSSAGPPPSLITLLGVIDVTARHARICLDCNARCSAFRALSLLIRLRRVGPPSDINPKAPHRQNWNSVSEQRRPCQWLNQSRTLPGRSPISVTWHAHAAIYLYVAVRRHFQQHRRLSGGFCAMVRAPAAKWNTSGGYSVYIVRKPGTQNGNSR